MVSDDGTVVIGDVLVTAAQQRRKDGGQGRGRSKRRAYAYTSSRWPGAVVPYEIAPSVGKFQFLAHLLQRANVTACSSSSAAAVVSVASSSFRLSSG